MASHGEGNGTPLPEGQRSLVDSPWGRRESDTTERLHFTHFILCHWRRKWHPTPVLLPGKSHGRRSLVDGPWGCRELDMTEQLHFSGFPGGACDKESACQCRRCKRRGFDPWVGKIPWRRKWLPTPVFLPGELHGQRSLVGYNPWGCKELDS